MVNGSYNYFRRNNKVVHVFLWVKDLKDQHKALKKAFFHWGKTTVNQKDLHAHG